MRICEWCQQSFEPSDTMQRYCKHTHAKAAQKKRSKQNKMLEFEKMGAMARFVCLTPEKKKYATKELADMHIERAISRDNSLRGILKSYVCRSCGFIHLTSH